MIKSPCHYIHISSPTTFMGTLRSCPTSLQKVSRPLLNSCNLFLRLLSKSQSPLTMPLCGLKNPKTKLQNAAISLLILY